MKIGISRWALDSELSEELMTPRTQRSEVEPSSETISSTSAKCSIVFPASKSVSRPSSAVVRPASATRQKISEIPILLRPSPLLLDVPVPIVAPEELSDSVSIKMVGEPQPQSSTIEPPIASEALQQQPSHPQRIIKIPVGLQTPMLCIDQGEDCPPLFNPVMVCFASLFWCSFRYLFLCSLHAGMPRPLSEVYNMFLHD
jgi:hypothetical protein